MQSKVLEGLELSGTTEVLLDLGQGGCNTELGKQPPAGCVTLVRWLVTAWLCTGHPVPGRTQSSFRDIYYI